MMPQRLFTGQIGDFELRLLKIFRTVVECGGFSLAEVELGLTKSAISKQMSDLEARLGVRLCDRGRGGFSLTEEGKIVYETSTTLFASVEDFRAKVNSFHEVVSGQLFLGFIDTLVTKEDSTLHAALRTYTTNYPDVDLNIMTGSAVEIDRCVQDRTIHVGVSTKNRGLKGIIATPLFEEENYLYCGRGHPLFETHGDVDVEDLKQHRFVRHGYSDAEHDSMTRIGIQATSNAHFTEDVLFLVLTGNFLGYLPAHFADSFVQQGKIKAVIPEKVTKRTSIQVIVNKLSIKNPVVASFVDVIQEIASSPKT